MIQYHYNESDIKYPDPKTVYEDCFYEGLRPPPDYKVWEWADQHRYVAASANSGKWKTEKTPYLKQIFECLSASHSAKRVVFMAGAQLGKTEGMINFCGYTMHLHPAPILFIEPTVDLARRLSKQRVAPAIANTPVLADIIKSNRSKDSGNEILHKEFNGESLVFAGANSAAGLRSMPACYVLADEVDGWPHDADGEGDPLDLAVARTATYWNKKIFIASTPTIKGMSKIEEEYLDSNKQKFYIPCPHPACGKKQVIEWENIKFKKNKKFELIGSPYLECKHCKGKIEEHHKPDFLSKGEWIAENPESKIEGFHLSALYSPLGWLSWKEAVEKFLKATKKKSQNLLKVWVNTVLGETWEDDKEDLEWEEYYNRRESYSTKPLPKGVRVITTTIDTQGDWLELLTVGWGKGEEAWSLEHKKFYGDVSKVDLKDKLNPWKQAVDMIEKKYVTQDGVMLKPERTGVDTGGNQTKAAYEFVYQTSFLGVFGLKGSPTQGSPLISVSRNSGVKKIRLHMIGTHTGKNLLLSRLKIKEIGEGYIHHGDHAEEYFKQLCSEKLVTTYHLGQEIKVWKKKRTRNEIWDLWDYQFACLELINLDWDTEEENYQAELDALDKPDEDVKEYQMNRENFATNWK